MSAPGEWSATRTEGWIHWPDRYPQVGQRPAEAGNGVQSPAGPETGVIPNNFRTASPFGGQTPHPLYRR
jgi:hypothetical protein